MLIRSTSWGPPLLSIRRFRLPQVSRTPYRSGPFISEYSFRGIHPEILAQSLSFRGVRPSWALLPPADVRLGSVCVPRSRIPVSNRRHDGLGGRLCSPWTVGDRFLLARERPAAPRRVRGRRSRGDAGHHPDVARGRRHRRSGRTLFRRCGRWACAATRPPNHGNGHARTGDPRWRRGTLRARPPCCRRPVPTARQPLLPTTHRGSRCLVVVGRSGAARAVAERSRTSTARAHARTDRRHDSRLASGQSVTTTFPIVRDASTISWARRMVAASSGVRWVVRVVRSVPASTSFATLSRRSCW